MSIVTKTGDKGTSGLFGGQRVSKDSPRLHAYGTVDELNAVIGIIMANAPQTPVSAQLLEIQHLLFRVGADLATPLSTKAKVDRIDATHTKKIEEWIDAYEKDLPPQTRFILPGGSPGSAYLHFARTVCRRAERWTVALSKEEAINPGVIIFLNRLSDYLFLLARFVNGKSGRGDVEVEYSP